MKVYFLFIGLLRRARTKMYFSFKRAAKIHPFSDIYGYGKRITRARVPLYFLHTHARHNKSSQRYADCLLIWRETFYLEPEKNTGTALTASDFFGERRPRGLK